MNTKAEMLEWMKGNLARDIEHRQMMASDVFTMKENGQPAKFKYLKILDEQIERTKVLIERWESE